MPTLTPQTYYSTQSSITDPKQHTNLYNGLPSTPDDISRVVQGLVLHYFGDKWQYNYPPERMAEINTRYVSAILDRIIELDARPLVDPRSPDARFIGCCRDFTALAVSMLRHVGIPARARHGFADYFEAGYYIDHVVVEYWNGMAWQLCDSEIDQRYFNLPVRDVPRDRFVVGGLAWQRCRAGQADPDQYGLGSIAPLKGWAFIRSRMMEDLAALNKTEMLCWEEWTLDQPQEQLTTRDLELLDHVAEVTQQGDVGFEEVRRLFTEEPRLKLPPVFRNFSPAHPPQELPLMLSLA